MTSRKGGDICEMDAPFLFDVRAAARTVVWIGVRVPAKPEVDGSVMFRQINLKRLRIGLAIDPLETFEPAFPPELPGKTRREIQTQQQMLWHARSGS